MIWTKFSFLKQLRSFGLSKSSCMTLISWLRQFCKFSQMALKLHSVSFGFGGVISIWNFALKGNAIHRAIMRYSSLFSRQASSLRVSTISSACTGFDDFQ